MASAIVTPARSPATAVRAKSTLKIKMLTHRMATSVHRSMHDG
jgi:hypothetical protein